ncbi:MAG TPA: DUF5916 domain-containing protein [Longimicrobiales bacterium]|nr:DUF5916 domain-containing protein [Longimicrobiales bacterium]
MRIPTLPLALAGLASAWLIPGCVHAQNSAGATATLNEGRSAPEARGVVDVPRLTGPITLDGVSDEAAWQAVSTLPLTMYEPSFRGTSDRSVELRMAYDDEAIYLAASFFHEDPSAIKALSLTRDRWSGDDSFGLLLDTFNDNENSVRFVALPLGTRMDMAITGDGQGVETGALSSGSWGGLSWNTFWDLETRITDQGWFGEMRIPFSSLRFETDIDGAVVMGVMAYAYEPAKGYRWTYPAIPPTSPYTQVSAMQDIRFRGVASRNPVYMSPYALAGTVRSAELNAAGDHWDALRDQSYEVGGDLKINPTPNLTLDVTVNTDFAAVEADQQQVNLTRFSLFFDEKRPFFQERAGIFSFETGADKGTLFYSRRIGLADGHPVRLLGGARLVGRVGGWDLGFIEMQTGDRDGLASENFGVLRLRRRVLNPNSYVGGMATTRVGGGLHNVTYGLDGQFRVAGDEYVTLKWLQTLQGGDAVRDAAPAGVRAGRAVVDWTRRRQAGFSYHHALVWSGAGYDPALGFESRTDFTRGQSDWNYQWYPGETSSFRRVWLGLQSNVWVRNADHRVDTEQVKPFLTLETNPGASLTFSVNHTYEDVPEAFSLSADADIPLGSYRATEGSVEFRAARGWTLRPDFAITAGQFFDGSRTGLKSGLSWAVDQHLELITGWEWNRIRFDERNQAFDAHLLRLQARGAVDVHLSIDAFFQYNSLTDVVSANARFRYNFREGQDLWLVWNEGLNMQREVLGVPRLPFSQARVLTMKYTHTLVF